MAFPSMAHIFLDRIQKTPNQVAFEFRPAPEKQPDTWRTMSWAEAGGRVEQIARGLMSLGVEKGDRCAILSNTRVEWILCDLGILCSGAATTTIYANNTPEDCAYILNDSGAKICFVEDAAQLAKLVELRSELGHVEKVISIEATESQGDWVLSLEALEQLGTEGTSADRRAYQERIDSITPEDLATLIYTSGTTGNPKGVMLLHDCWVYQAESIVKNASQYLEPNDKQYCFLPLAHSYAKVLELVGIAFGAQTVVDGDIDHFITGVQQTKPTFIPAVPRVFEKAYNRIVQRAKAAGGIKYKIFKWATEVGKEVVSLQMKGRRPGLALALQHRLADRLVYARVRDAFGGRVRAFVSGGAPLSPDIGAFFFAAGMPVLEGYGLTETAAVATANRMEEFKLGTVGKPGDGTQMKIADDGEILIKSRSIMRGYFNMEEATHAAIQEGWFHTGDLGEFDEEGFLKITGRKKDLIITAGGKNIAPQTIENKIKAECPYVSQVVMHGDKRNFCVALITLDEESIREWGHSQGIQASSYQEWAQHPQVKELIWGYVKGVNQELSSYESIKYIHLLPRDLSIEEGEITPSMKVKRSVVEQRYQEVLDGFYQGAVEAL